MPYAIFCRYFHERYIAFDISMMMLMAAAFRCHFAAYAMPHMLRCHAADISRPRHDYFAPARYAPAMLCCHAY